MTNLKRGKKLIIVLLCFVFCFTCCFSCLKIVNYNQQLQATNNTSYSDMQAYDFSIDNLSDDDASEEIYGTYTYFKIKDYEALLNFSYSVANGYTFLGKLVYLEKDIDRSAEGNCKNDNWHPIGVSMYWNNGGVYNKNNGVFKGIFDGQGHTILNLRTQINKDDVRDFIRVGLFGTIEGYCYQDVASGTCAFSPVEIKNVKIKNFTIDVQYSTIDSGWYASALVAEAKGLSIISNCVVEGFTFNLPADSHDPYFGGLVCYYETSSDWLNWENYGGNPYVKGIYTSALVMDNVLLNEMTLSDVQVEQRKGYFAFLGPVITETHTTTIGLLTYNNSFLPINSYVDSSEVKNITNEGFEVKYEGSGYSDKQTYKYKPTLYYNNVILKDYTGKDSKTGRQYAIMNENVYHYQLYSNNLDYACWSDSEVDNVTIVSTLSEDANWYVPNTNQFNDGCPYLEIFMKYLQYKFTVDKNSEKMGTVDISALLVPDVKKIFGSSTSIMPSTNSNTVNVYGYTITAEANEGCKFTKWNISADKLVYTATFEIKKIKVTFGTTVGKVSISATLDVEETEWNYGTTLKVMYNREQQKIEAKVNNVLVAHWTLRGQNKIYCLSDDDSIKIKLSEDITINPNVTLKIYEMNFK